MRLVFLSTLFAIVFSQLLESGPAFAASEPRCGGEVVCELDGRRYHVRVPKSWNGESALPVILYFHGWARTGRVPLGSPRTGAAADANDVMMIAIDGLNRSWDFWDAASRRDVDYALKVMDDVRLQWPIDENRKFIGGYSWGGIMAERFACEAGTGFAALFSIAGPLTDENRTCPAGAIDLYYIHGTTDNVVDLPFGPDRDPQHAVDIWRKTNGCPTSGRLDPKGGSFTIKGNVRPFVSYHWESCESGRSIRFDVHKRGHFVPPGWLEWRLGDALQKISATN